MITSLPLASCITMDDLEVLRSNLLKTGFRVLELDGSTIQDRQSFFSSARRSLPLDPPLQGANWDALNDSLWNGIAGMAAPRVVILWTEVDNMLAGALEDLLTAVDCLVGVARELSDPASGNQRVLLQVVLLGRGENFRRRIPVA